LAVKGIIFISNVQKALEHEWFVDAVNVKELELEFVLFNSKNSELSKFISSKGFKCKNYSLLSKYFIPFYIIYFFFKLLFKKYDFIHCHLLEASFIGIVAAKYAGVKKRIHTRHHSDFHHSYFPHAVKWDLIVNHFSTDIIAVSKSVAEILVEKEHVSKQKLRVILHGIPKSVMESQIPQDEIENMKKKYGIMEFSPIIGVVSRFTHWKGVQYIIPAFKELLKEYPKAKLILANARGEFEKEIKTMLDALPNRSYVIIEFENNMPPLFKTFDVFVHAPINKNYEAFGQVYIEALCYGIPMVCTLSGIGNELIHNERNALVVPYQNSPDIKLAIERIVSNSELKSRLVTNGKMDVQQFNFEEKFNRIKAIYLS